MRRLASALLVWAAIHVAGRELAAQAPTITQIAASWHVLALLSDGTVSATGRN